MPHHNSGISYYILSMIFSSFRKSYVYGTVIRNFQPNGFTIFISKRSIVLFSHPIILIFDISLPDLFTKVTLTIPNRKVTKKKYIMVTGILADNMIADRFIVALVIIPLIYLNKRNSKRIMFRTTRAKTT